MPYIGNPIYQSAFVTDSFSGTGSQTAYTMSVAPAGTTNVLIAVSGVLQDPSTYGVVGNTLNFTTAPPSGTANISVRYLGIPVTGVTTTAYRTKTEFTATAGQTTFTPPSYTVGYIDVFRNGVLLGSADYTASNGTTVVLTTGATSGDLITTESFYVSSVLNAIPNTAGSVGSANIAGGAITQSLLGTNVAGNGPAFSAYASAGTSISNTTATKILYATNNFDTNSNFSSSRFTPTVAGYYQINASTRFASTTLTATLITLSIYKNGSSYQIAGGSASSSYLLPCVSAVVYCNGSTDYIEIYGYQNSGGTITSDNGTNYVFSGCLVRSA